MKKAFTRATATILSLIVVSMAQGGGDVRRRTIAITYLKDPVKVILRGTTLRPEARGEATVERWRKRNESEIDITVENLIPAFNYGADYTTYVLWAITPEGQVDNLGEFRLSGGSGHLHAATPYQTFAMIVTAEPHFMVKLPSRMVVLENLAPPSKNVQIQSSEIYFTGDSGKYYTDTTVPALAERDYNKIPMELLQARRAVQIARLAEGERYDPADMGAAVRQLEEAEAAFRRGESVHEVGRIAREAIALAVRTREIAEERAAAAARRAEIARRDEEVRRVSENLSDLQARLAETETRLKASELARTSAEDQLNRALREAAEAKAEINLLRQENERLRAENDRLNHELQDARSRMADVNARLSETTSRLEAMERAEREKREAEARRRQLATLQSLLSQIVATKPSGDGFIAVLPDSFFVAGKTDLALRIKPKIAQLAKALAAYPGVRFTIVGHSDPRRAAEAEALGRAQAVGDYLAALGVSRSNFKVESRGDTEPIASNKTLRGRAMNRRVELVFASP
jgi:outer membrane protein OmpA-like peptidoglycan-associated protein